MTWRGWPGKATNARLFLDELYWGDDDRRPDAPNHYHPALVYSAVGGNHLATFRSAHTEDDQAGMRVRRFVSGWREWRLYGYSPEARRAEVRKAEAEAHPITTHAYLSRLPITAWTHGKPEWRA